MADVNNATPGGAAGSRRSCSETRVPREARDGRRAQHRLLQGDNRREMKGHKPPQLLPVGTKSSTIPLENYRGHVNGRRRAPKSPQPRPERAATPRLQTPEKERGGPWRLPSPLGLHPCGVVWAEDPEALPRVEEGEGDGATFPLTEGVEPPPPSLAKERAGGLARSTFFHPTSAPEEAIGRAARAGAFASGSESVEPRLPRDRFLLGGGGSEPDTTGEGGEGRGMTEGQGEGA